MEKPSHEIVQPETPQGIFQQTESVSTEKGATYEKERVPVSIGDVIEIIDRRPTRTVRPVTAYEAGLRQVDQIEHEVVGFKKLEVVGSKEVWTDVGSFGEATHVLYIASPGQFRSPTIKEIADGIAVQGGLVQGLPEADVIEIGKGLYRRVEEVAGDSK